MHSVITRIVSQLPPDSQEHFQSFIPLAKPTTAGLLSLAPLISILAATDFPQVMWWLFPGCVMGTVVLSLSWIEDSVIEIDNLENMKYEAKGV